MAITVGTFRTIHGFVLIGLVYMIFLFIRQSCSICGDNREIFFLLFVNVFVFYMLLGILHVVKCERLKGKTQ